MMQICQQFQTIHAFCLFYVIHNMIHFLVIQPICFLAYYVVLPSIHSIQFLVCKRKNSRPVMLSGGFSVHVYAWHSLGRWGEKGTKHTHTYKHIETCKWKAYVILHNALMTRVVPTLSQTRRTHRTSISRERASYA